MTTAYHSSKILLLIRKYGFENKRLSLFSPLTLLVLLAFVFTFFLTASGENYSKKSLNETEMAKKNEVSKSDSEMMYKNIVTNGDAIRSVLQ